jgi:hypothetical protein
VECVNIIRRQIIESVKKLLFRERLTGLHNGAPDLDRNIMPVGRAYQKLIQQWCDVLSIESCGLYFRH